MAIERTLSIIKPDAVERALIGQIVSRLGASGLQPVGMRMKRLTLPEAEGFYAEHREKPFFRDLTAYMTSGPVVLMVLEGEDAIQVNRKVMGATNPEKAEAGTLRKDFGINTQRNSVHGSDSPASAAREIAYFFSSLDLCSYAWDKT
jgi:nucleoside-diphosphate kinase